MIKSGYFYQNLIVVNQKICVFERKMFGDFSDFLCSSISKTTLKGDKWFKVSSPLGGKFCYCQTKFFKFKQFFENFNTIKKKS